MNDKIIKFPGATPGKPENKSLVEVKASTPEPEAADKAIGDIMNEAIDQAATGTDETVMMVTKRNLDGSLVQVPISPDQAKALEIIMSGKTFVMIGMSPSNTGSDFWTAIHGDETELRNAHEHLYGVIDRAFNKRGL